jgi:copper oxidase (laccase) domain-containing protein
MQPAFMENLNRGRFETWTIRPSMEVLHVAQVHGVDIATAETLPCEADGLVVSWQEFGRPLAIKTADCMPIVIEGEKGAVFVHAGWRGLADGILKRPEIALISPQRVLIGPCIHNCCFEVSPDFRENFKGSTFFTELEGKLYFDSLEKRSLAFSWRSFRSAPAAILAFTLTEEIKQPNEIGIFT